VALFDEALPGFLISKFTMNPHAGLLSAVVVVAAGLGLASAAPAESVSVKPAASILHAPSRSVDLGGGVQLEFVLIPAGSFIMGSDENTGDGDESPQHKVIFTRPFYLGKYEVTQEQWEKIMAHNPSHFKGAKLPVETVSWNDCQRFLAKLHEKTKLPFALPTEAQWEYACRAGTTTTWSFGGNDAAIRDYAWQTGNSQGTPHPVGEKKPNPWNLYDMHGNVGEWCADWYVKHAYPGEDVKDPRGPAAPLNGSRVVRGGAWGDPSDYLRCAYRNCNGPNDATYGIGLRCVLEVE
jgi:formylglycine-generating enzyme required for sulfatase activity